MEETHEELNEKIKTTLEATSKVYSLLAYRDIDGFFSTHGDVITNLVGSVAKQAATTLAAEQACENTLSCLKDHENTIQKAQGRYDYQNLIQKKEYLTKKKERLHDVLSFYKLSIGEFKEIWDKTNHQKRNLN
ncbi:unnamed protein product [Caenorhabditis auriculariae]|uniref:Uncharacterized protein n=1 Tax=Caenorhabditis auriculariae TaxID=2777116 RepID=A0A8S1GRG4_9PELO|nr:unnamed protein product [Caenorhabditis auriculariae]